MSQLVEKALMVTRILAIKAARGTLNEHEAQLYEASSRFITTILNFKDATAQSALIKAERELNALQQQKGTIE